MPVMFRWAYFWEGLCSEFYGISNGISMAFSRVFHSFCEFAIFRRLQDPFLAIKKIISEIIENEY